MQVYRKNMFFLILHVSIFLLAGCTVRQEPFEVVLKHGSTKQPKNNSMSKRFQESDSKSQTAVESAIELSEKYTKLSDKLTVLRQKNQDLVAENNRAKDQLAVLEPELKQTKKELDEANDLLIEMRIELNNWKTNILGFRDEIRSAETEQLVALVKILEILGGEVKAESIQDANSAAILPNVSKLSQALQNPTLGESNE